jgi:hypothetical protein
MYCSGCGQALAPGQTICPQCGRPVAPPAPPVPGFEFELDNYRSRVRALGVVWFVYAGLSLLLGFAALSFARTLLLGGVWNWTNGPWMGSGPPPAWIVPLMHLAWLKLVIRSMLAVVAGWGLLEHVQWGRIVAIVAGILSLIHFPLGTALGIWTLVMLLGYRNSTLYQQL